MDMKTVLGAIVTGTVAIIFIGSLLAPQLAIYIADNGSLHEYSGILGAVIVVSVVAVLMLFVRLITTGRD